MSAEKIDKVLKEVQKFIEKFDFEKQTEEEVFTEMDKLIELEQVLIETTDVLNEQLQDIIFKFGERGFEEEEEDKEEEKR